MKRPIVGLLAVTFVAVLMFGCTQSDDKQTSDKKDANPPAKKADATTALCGKCGEEKGSDTCCAEDAEKCEKCGLTKGSTLCCAELADDAKGKDLCAKCGHVSEDGHICDSDCEECEKCGLHKGSPLCCKIKEDS